MKCKRGKEGIIKRYVLLAIALCFVVGMLSCGGGGGSKSYEFYGRWLFQTTLVDYNRQCYFTGTLNRAYTIHQNGEEIVLIYSDQHFRGTCSPSAGTFVINGWCSNGLFHEIQGRIEDDNTMSGSWRTSKGVCWGLHSWTAELVSRSIEKEVYEDNNVAPPLDFD